MNLLSKENPVFAKNFRYLSESCPNVADYLRAHDTLDGLGLARAEDGSPVLIVDGLSQDSRVSPRSSAQKLLESSLRSGRENEGFWLFGLGSPATLSEAAKALPAVSAYEPDHRVIMATLCLLDLGEPLKAKKVKIYCPFDKAGGNIAPGPANLITHQPSMRRSLAAWVGFAGLLGRDPAPGARLLIVPPYFGGSEPMGGFLFRAAQTLGLPAKLLAWPESLGRRAMGLRNDPAANPGDLMAASAREIVSVAQGFGPSLILGLAQAPLDARGLALLRKETKGALLAFWFVEDYTRFRYVNEIAPAYDLFFHIQGALMDGPSRRWGLSQSFYLPAAADDAVFKPQSAPGPYRATLSAAGAGYPNRRAILADLAANHWPRTGRAEGEFKIFGSGWEGCPPVLARHLFEAGRRISTEECAMVYNGGQINLNVHSGDGAGFDGPSAFVNPRTFELACCGAAQIVDKRHLLDDLFGPGELETVDDPSQLPEAIDKHLRDPELGRAMGQKARRKTLSRHLYVHRLSSILERSGLWRPSPEGP
ncbi:MAG: glycosyltransferase [Deltaproteobacteria bacterium]|jgi:spore maturation protein CgeB|nr:glycosyltransferase [Deltaproteobacteria bacterium]